MGEKGQKVSSAPRRSRGQAGWSRRARKAASRQLRAARSFCIPVLRMRVKTREVQARS